MSSINQFRKSVKQQHLSNYAGEAARLSTFMDGILEVQLNLFYRIFKVMELKENYLFY